MSWAIEISRSMEHTGWADEMGKCKAHTSWADEMNRRDEQMDEPGRRDVLVKGTYELGRRDEETR